ncbi:hypothetical protein ACTPOE_08370 [Castellaniella sp. WN]
MAQLIKPSDMEDVLTSRGGEAALKNLLGRLNPKDMKALFTGIEKLRSEPEFRENMLHGLNSEERDRADRALDQIMRNIDLEYNRLIFDAPLSNIRSALQKNSSAEIKGELNALHTSISALPEADKKRFPDYINSLPDDELKTWWSSLPRLKEAEAGGPQNRLYQALNLKLQAYYFNPEELERAIQNMDCDCIMTALANLAEKAKIAHETHGFMPEMDAKLQNLVSQAIDALKKMPDDTLYTKNESLAQQQERMWQLLNPKSAIHPFLLTHEKHEAIISGLQRELKIVTTSRYFLDATKLSKELHDLMTDHEYIQENERMLSGEMAHQNHVQSIVQKLSELSTATRTAKTDPEATLSIKSLLANEIQTARGRLQVSADPANTLSTHFFKSLNDNTLLLLRHCNVLNSPSLELGLGLNVEALEREIQFRISEQGVEALNRRITQGMTDLLHTLAGKPVDMPTLMERLCDLSESVWPDGNYKDMADRDSAMIGSAFKEALLANPHNGAPWEVAYERISTANLLVKLMNEFSRIENNLVEPQPTSSFTKSIPVVLNQIQMTRHLLAGITQAWPRTILDRAGGGHVNQSTRDILYKPKGTVWRQL